MATAARRRAFGKFSTERPGDSDLMNWAERNTPLDWMRAILWLIGRILLYTLAVVGTIYVLGRLKMVLIYVIIAVILAYIMRPIANHMARRGIGVPRGASLHLRRSITTLYVLILLFVGGYFSVKWTLSPFVAQVREVTTNWEGVYKPRFEKYSSDVRDWYTRTLKPEWRERIEKPFKQSGNPDIQNRATALATDVGHRFGEVAHQIVEIVLLPVLAFYFALDSRKLKHEFVGSLPRSWRKETSRMIHEFNLIMHSYVVGQAILCALAGVVVGLWLFLWHVPFALTLGLLAGFTRAIPIIGPIIGGIPIVILTLVTAGVPAAVAVLAFFTFLHFAESKFVMPMLIGERMNLHPVIIILVLLIGQEFGGLLGMFFAPPLAALVRVIIRRYWLKCHLRGKAPRVPPISTTRVPVEID
jgi:predicted PurR-regulated permease PerM